MISLPRPLLAVIAGAAEAAYPEECCGLLAGRRADDGAIVVSRVQPSPNLSGGDKRRSFEVDPKVRFDLMRELEADAAAGEEIVGHYHSHPFSAAAPSARDQEMVYEPDMVWLIMSAEGGRAGQTTAHLADPEGGRLHQIELRLTE